MIKYPNIAKDKRLIAIYIFFNFLNIFVLKELYRNEDCKKVKIEGIWNPIIEKIYHWLFSISSVFQASNEGMLKIYKARPLHSFLKFNKDEINKL